MTISRFENGNLKAVELHQFRPHDAVEYGPFSTTSVNFLYTFVTRQHPSLPLPHWY